MGLVLADAAADDAPREEALHAYLAQPPFWLSFPPAIEQRFGVERAVGQPAGTEVALKLRTTCLSPKDLFSPWTPMFALITLWLTVLLTVIASGFAYSMRGEALAARGVEVEIQAKPTVGTYWLAYDLSEERAADNAKVERGEVFGGFVV